MLLALDLNERQATRVLEQALRTRAKLEIEPRPEPHGALLWATLVAKDENGLLKVDLHDCPADGTLSTLIGAHVDVRMMIDGELFLFSTFVVDASEGAVPQKLSLAVPELLQVANRRRVVRKTPNEPVPIRLMVPGSHQSFVAELANIGQGGIGCRVPNGELDALLLIGERVEIEFALPWAPEVYHLTAAVCSKTAFPDERVIVGLEFLTPDQPSAATLQHLRVSLVTETSRLSDVNGEL
jgi:hypothetical protein